MLEARIKLNHAMEELKSAEEVDNLFDIYLETYDKIKYPNEQTRLKHAKIFFTYMDYMKRCEVKTN